MTDLKLKYTFTDRGGSKVYNVIDPRQTHFCAGQVRIPPDPQIAELESENVRLDTELALKDRAIIELEAQLTQQALTIAELTGHREPVIEKLEARIDQLQNELMATRNRIDNYFDPMVGQADSWLVQIDKALEGE